MPRVWLTTLWQHGAVLATGFLVGWVYSVPLIGLLSAGVILLGWHLYHLYLLERWLRTGRHGPLPSGNGPWSQVLARIEAIREDALTHKANWRRLVKELRASTKAFPDGGVILGPENEIIRANKVARRLLGLKKKRDRGAPIDNLIRHPDFVSFLRRGGKRESVELPAPVGQDVWVSCRIIPYGADQKLLLVRDISRNVKMERVRRDFVANASHELRSPLTVIAGYLDVMADDDTLPETWQAPVRDMRAQAERMSALVRDLLTLSKLESSQKASIDNLVDMPSLLAAAAREASSLDGSIREVELQIDDDALLRGDESELKSVVTNLVSNAVRYTPDDGHITIRWSADRKGAHLSVADTGIGIPEEEIPRLTERFYRADGGRARQQGGTGLGLAIVKHALKRHDAELEIESQVGVGSRFTCHFPLSRLQAAPQLAEGSRA
jgi:two-component system phosphate regulon sensor histidine kinase PhoR